MERKDSNRAARSSSRMLRYAICLVMLATAAVPLHAQLTVSIQGRVNDTTGAGISGATVNAVNSATGLSRTVTANATGDYQFTALPVGDYTVTADKAGFKKEAKK